MKCTCTECEGTGRCPDCNGEGEIYARIEHAQLDEDMDGYEVLVELKADAERVIRQSKELTVMKPHMAEHYQEQLDATLAMINRQADRAAAKPKPKTEPKEKHV